jgi:D-alanine-D-alanine ligase
MNRTRVVVIGGGQNSEHGVSLASAAGVSRALADAGHHVTQLTISQDGIWLDRHHHPLGRTRPDSLARAIDLVATYDVAVPMVHGAHGEDGTLAALCDLAGIRSVGTGVIGSAIGMDKCATKRLATSLGISVANGTVTTTADLVFEHPVVVKPVVAGSSHGVSLVQSAAELGPALTRALALSSRVLVEEVLVGREVDIAVMRCADGSLLVGPPLEIHTPDGALFDTGLKYASPVDGNGGHARDSQGAMTCFEVPAPLTTQVQEEMEAAALAMYEALDANGVGRVDFVVTAQGLVLNEVNTTPGMTEHSQVPRMFDAIGVSYGALLEELVAAARRPVGLAGRVSLPS